MIKKIMACCIIFMGLMTNIVFADVKKDETIYINLNYDGSVSDIVVVNHIYGSTDKETFVDYGEYKSVTNLVNNIKPEIQKDHIMWSSDAIKDSDFYYQGILNDSSLPITINIDYYLNGKIIEPKDIKGENGNLKIHCKVVNNTKNSNDNNYPMMVQVGVVANLDLFNNIKTTNSINTVVGKKMNINYVLFPSPEDSFSIEMNGKNIELDPITFTIIPQSIPIPEVFKENLEEMKDGFIELEDGTLQLVSASGDIINGSKELKDGVIEFNKGINELSEALKELSNNTDGITSGLDVFADGFNDIEENSKILSQSIVEMEQGLVNLKSKGNEINSGLNDIITATQNLNNGISGYKQGFDSIIPLISDQDIQILMSSTDPAIMEIGLKMFEQKTEMLQLQDNYNNIVFGSSELVNGILEISNGYKEFYQNGLIPITQGAKQLALNTKEFENGISSLKSGFKSIYESWIYASMGIFEISNNMVKVNTNASILPNEINKLINGQKELKDGIYTLHKDGIKEINTSIEKEFDQFLYKDTIDKYKSFTNNTKNINSQVQFILRTPSISVEEEKDNIVKQNDKKVSFFEKLKELFKLKK